MNRRQMWWMISAVVTLCAVVTISAAQSAPEKKAEPAAKPAENIQFYRLDYSLRELQDGKVVNTRNFVTRIRGYLPNWGSIAVASIRVGTRVPIDTGKDGVQYTNVGVNIDSRLDAPGAMDITMEITSLSKPEAGQPVLPSGAPMMRSIRGSSIVPFTLNRQILVTSVDDILSQRRYELLVTITRDE